MSSPYDPHDAGRQPYQGSPEGHQDHSPPEDQPYQYPYPPGPSYPSSYPPAEPYQPGYQQPMGYPPGAYPAPEYQQWPAGPALPPRRPGALIVAGVLWLIEGVLLLGLGVLTAVADRLPGFEEAMRDSGRTVTHDELLTVGVTSAIFGVLILGLGLAVFLTGATWARVLVTLLALPPTLLLFVLLLPPLMTITATVLQFLPAVNSWVRRPVRG